MKPAETRRSLPFIQTARLRRAIESEKGVVNDAAIAWLQFHSPHMPARRQRNRDDKGAIDIFAFGRQEVGFGHRDHEIGRP
jgi:hypothetical protein